MAKSISWSEWITGPSRGKLLMEGTGDAGSRTLAERGKSGPYTHALVSLDGALLPEQSERGDIVTVEEWARRAGAAAGRAAGAAQKGRGEYFDDRRGARRLTGEEERVVAAFEAPSLEEAMPAEIRRRSYLQHIYWGAGRRPFRRGAA